MGRVIRAYRRHPWHGKALPQERVAQWLCLSQAQLSRVENGPALQDLARLISWARILGLPSDLLWFKLPGEDPLPSWATRCSPKGYTDPVSYPAGEYETVKGSGGRFTQEEADGVRRSEFLKLGGVTLAGALAPPLIHGWPDRQAPSLPKLTDELLARLRAQTEGFRWLDRRQGSVRLLPATVRYAGGLANLWRLTDGPEQLRVELGLVAADTCHLAAYQAFDQGQHGRAVDWFRCSADLAARNGALDLYVFAMCGVANMHSRNDDPESARPILAQLDALQLAPVSRCYVAVYQAHAHAAARDRDQALAALDRARALAESTANEPPSPWLGITDVTWVDRQAALVLAKFGDREGLDILTALEADTPATFQRYRVTLDANFAQIYARMGEVEQAVERATAALRRNQGIDSVQKHTMITEARRVLQPHADAKEVIELDERLRASSAAAAPA
jgi:hypothetical protein